MTSLIKNKTRGFWLFFLAATFFTNFLLSAYEIYNKWVFGLSENYFLLMGGISLVFAITFFWLYIYYRCAYKNPGRKLLALFLIVSPLYQVSGIYIVFNQMRESPNFILAISFIVPFIIYVFFYIFSFKLFRLNKILQNELVHSSEEYISSYEQITSAWDPDILENRFSKATSNFPQIKRFLEEDYKKQKKLLEDIKQNVSYAIDFIKEQIQKKLLDNQNKDDIKKEFAWIRQNSQEIDSYFE